MKAITALAVVLMMVLTSVSTGMGDEIAPDLEVPPVRLLGKGQYESVNAAIEAARDGDIILVRAGDYYEDVYIDKAVTLIGEGPDVDYYSTVFVQSSDVTLQNHTFTNINNNNWNYAAGITTLNSYSSTIYRLTVKDCTFTNCRHGVYLFGAQQCVIEDSNFTNCYRGVSIQNHVIPSVGTVYSRSNTIRDCNFTNMKANGIWEGEAVAINDTDYNTVQDCYIDGCVWGVMVYGGDLNTVTRCTISNSTKDPLYICSVPTTNTFSFNDIRDNKGNVDIRHSRSVIFKNNTLENNSAPVHLLQSDRFTFTGNSIKGSSLLLDRSNYGNFADNAMENPPTRAIDIRATSQVNYDHSIPTTNTLNGDPIYYFYNTANPLVNNTTTGIVTFAYCTNPNVTNTEVVDGDGILLVNSPYSNITANVTNCTVGIEAVNSGNGLIDGCVIDTGSRGQFGIRMLKSAGLVTANTRITTTTAPAWRLEGTDVYKCYNTTFPYTSISANQNGGGELWVYSTLTVLVLENETLMPLAGVDGHLKADAADVYKTPHFGGADMVTNSTGVLGPFTLLDRAYKYYHVPVETNHDLDLWLGADATWSRSLRGINMSKDKLLVFETSDVWKPGIPANFLVTDVPDEDALEVSWSLNPDDTVSYYLWSNISGSWSLLDTLASTVDIYRIDQGLVHGTPYYFSLSAVDEVPLESDRTGVEMVTHVDNLAPGTPMGLQATAINGTNVTLEWQGVSDPDLVGYRVYINATGGDENGPWVMLTPSTGQMATMLWVQGLTSETPYHFVVAAIDERPNESPRSQVLSINTADITPPDAPVVDALPEYTNVVRHAITGTAEPGSTLRLMLNGVMVGETTVPVNGRFSVDVDLEDGVNVITTRAIDPSLNVGPLSVEVSTILDRDAPLAPRLDPLPGLTNVPGQTVTGNAEAFSTVTVYLNDAVVGTVETGDDGAFEVAITLVEGENTVTARATDRALNQGSQSSLITVVLDTIAPEVPLVNALPAYTNEEDLTVSGTAEAGTTVELLIGGSVDATVTAGPQGGYSFDITLGTRLTAISVRATDPAGNVGVASQTYQVILDKVPPSPSAGEDIEAIEDTQVGFDGSASTDNEGIASYQWSFQLGGSEVTMDGVTASYIFPDVVTVTVTLTVTDLAGNTAEDIVEVVIKSSNSPPTLRRDAMNPPDGNTGTKFKFSVEFFDPDGDTGEVWIYIDGESYIMTPDPDDTNPLDGTTYIYETKLTKGEHSYYFTGKDSFGNDAEGSSVGQDNAKSSPDIEKKKVSDSPGVGVSMALAALLVLALVARRRRR